MARRHHDFHHRLCLYGAGELMERKEVKQTQKGNDSSGQKHKRVGTVLGGGALMAACCVTSAKIESKK